MTRSEAVRYENIPELTGLYLEESYVLDIAVLETSLVLSLDLVLTPAHESFTPPRPGEQYCYRRARIKISSAQSIRWVEKVMRPFSDATGETDYGNIDSWLLDGDHTVISGEWGVLAVDGGAVSLEFEEAAD